MRGQKSRSIGLRVEGIENDYNGRSLCYIDQRVVEKLQLLTGSIIEIRGNKTTTGIVIPSITDRGKNIIRLNNLQLLNAGVKIGDFIRINEAEVFHADEIELTPTSAESALLTQKEAIKAKIINKPIVKGDVIEILEAVHQVSDPEDPVNHFINPFSKPTKKRTKVRSMQMVVEKTQPPNKIVRITRETSIKVNNCIAILNKRGKIVSYEYPSCNKKDDNEYRRVIEDLLIYTENLEDRIKNIETEKQVINLERKKLEYGKSILNDAIERLTSITGKLLESPILSNVKYGNLENIREEGGVSELRNLEDLNRNLSRLDRLVADNSSEENSQNTRYCKYCGGEVEDNQIYCRDCGTRIK